MSRVLAALFLFLLAACASPRYESSTPGSRVFVESGPVVYYRPLIYRGYFYPAWYAGSFPYAYCGFPPPWGFSYCSPNFYPYYFSVAYSWWPDYYGGWYGPWSPPYYGHWHSRPTGGPGSAPPFVGMPPGPPAVTGTPGPHGGDGGYRMTKPGYPVYRTRGTEAQAGAGLSALYGNVPASPAIGSPSAGAGKQRYAFPPPANPGPAFLPPASVRQPAPAMRPAAPRMRTAPRATSPARDVHPSARNPEYNP